MSNNSYVVEDGEMGRAQVEQAWAAGAIPHVDMNPILLKPVSDTKSQVILNGKIWKPQSNAMDYFSPNFLSTLYTDTVLPSLTRLTESNDVVVIEGAGSCAEVNLWDKDIVNWKVALAANAKVIIVADIERCGVFAQLLGTFTLLPPEYKNLVCGFVVNKFRGDRNLFLDGVKFIEDHSKLPVLGVIPMNREIHIDSEDGLMPYSVIDPPLSASINPEKINIAVLLLPHASNITDFHPLEREPAVNLNYLFHPRNLINYDVVIIPGTKNTIDDLRWMKSIGWLRSFEDIKTSNAMVIGICGGYQILGQKIDDVAGMEGGGIEEGLSLLDVETKLLPNKCLKRVQMNCWLQGLSKELSIDGYEIHTGETKPVRRENQKRSTVTVMKDSQNANDHSSDQLFIYGAQSDSGKIWGSYLHGVFDDPIFRKELLTSIKSDAIKKYGTNQSVSITAYREQQYEALADLFSKNFNVPELNEILSKS